SKPVRLRPHQASVQTWKRRPPPGNVLTDIPPQPCVLPPVVVSVKGPAQMPSRPGGLGTVVVVVPGVVTVAAVERPSTGFVARTSNVPGVVPAVRLPDPSIVPVVADQVTVTGWPKSVASKCCAPPGASVTDGGVTSSPRMTKAS